MSVPGQGRKDSEGPKGNCSDTVTGRVAFLYHGTVVPDTMRTENTKPIKKLKPSPQQPRGAMQVRGQKTDMERTQQPKVSKIMAKKTVRHSLHQQRGHSLIRASKGVLWLPYLNQSQK